MFVTFDYLQLLFLMFFLLFCIIIVYFVYYYNLLFPVEICGASFAVLGKFFSHVLGLGIKTDTEFNTEISTELFVSGTGKY